MNVLISGAGIAGLMFSYLVRHGHDVTVVEKSSSLRDEGYMMDFFGAGYDVCERLGLLSDLEKIHYPIPRLAFLDAFGRERVSVPYADVRRLFGGRHFNFMRGDLERLLYEKVKDHVEIRFGTSVQSFQQDDRRVSAVFSDGAGGSFDSLIGADGIHSQVRSLAFGPEEHFLHHLGYLAAAFTIDDPPADLRHTDAFSTLTVPGRLVAIYPIRGDRLATFFMHKSSRTPNEPSGVDARQELQRVYGDLDWVVPDLLARYPSSNLYFDSVSQIRMPHWRQGRVVLLGDACQCVSVIAGQGASLAIAGADVLADELEQAENDVPGAFARYESRMKPSIEKKQKAGRNMARWFVPDSRIRVTIRNLVMRAAGLPVTAALLRHVFAARNSIKL